MNISTPKPKTAVSALLRAAGLILLTVAITQCDTGLPFQKQDADTEDSLLLPLVLIATANNSAQLEPLQSAQTPAVKFVATGTYHTCALLDTGKVRCWGAGSIGRLGYGNTESIGDDEYPYTAGDVEIGGTVTQIGAGSAHTCALLETGKVRCWGQGGNGRLGYGNTNHMGDTESPSAAGDIDLGGTVTKIAVGAAHNCALLDTGKVRCWGYGSVGRLGYGNLDDIGDNENPSAAGDVNVGGTVKDITAGSFHTCALLDTGKVRCWGHSGYGQLGYGNTDTIGDTEDPASAGDVNLGGNATQIKAGEYHTCALLSTGKVRCWGNANEGQLGYANTTRMGDDEDPAGDVNIGGKAISITSGASHNCALLDTGHVRCWGKGLYGRLGYGNTEDVGETEHPYSLGNVNVGGKVIHISAGAYHTCAVMATGNVRCWGYGAFGQLGYYPYTQVGDNETPATVGDVNVLNLNNFNL